MLEAPVLINASQVAAILAIPLSTLYEYAARRLSEVRGKIEEETPKTHKSRDVPLVDAATEVIAGRIKGRNAE